MVPPPATPAPSRFLASKRLGTQQPHSQTPDQQPFTGPHRFHATPRFTASTPKPASTQTGAFFATPGLSVKPRAPKGRSTQDIIDDDSSPVSAGEDPVCEPPGLRDQFPEPIEFDSSLVPQSSSPDEGRSPKRRRISIASSEVGDDSVVSSQHSGYIKTRAFPDATDDLIVSDHSDLDDDGDLHDDEDPPTSPGEPPTSPHRSPSPDANSDEDSNPYDPTDEASSTNLQVAHHTTTTTTAATTLPNPAHHSHHHFHPAPRFKPPEPPDHHLLPSPNYPATPTYLADIFSPQRRGAKYLPGGLAAELRDWLVEVKGGVDGEGEGKVVSSVLGSGSGSGSASSGGAVVKVVIGEVSRGGAGMTLVGGRVCGGGGGGEAVGVKVILAGEGNFEGLGGGVGGGRTSGGNWARVGAGSLVAISPPAWDVELEGVRWAVAYRWEVVDGGGETR